MMKVTIIGLYKDSNKGSSAIAWGLINRLRKTGIISSISVISLLEDNSPYFASSFRFLKKRFPDLSYYSSPVKHECGSVRKFLNVLGLLLKLRFFKVKTLAKNNPALKAIHDSDLIITRGGPFFAASGSLINLSLISHSWPILFSRKAGLPYAFAPESVGPFYSFTSRIFASSMFGRAEFVTVRENLSKDILKSLGIPENKIHVLLDSAFWVETDMSQRVHRVIKEYELSEKKFLAVTCRTWDRIPMEKYHRELAKAIDTIVPNLFPQVALVLNTYSPEGMADDRKATLQLYNFIKKKAYVQIIEEDLSPSELVALYSKSRLLLGTRLHSVILALAGGTPVLAISYSEHKTHGVMQLLGLGHFTSDMKTFNHTWVSEMIEPAINEQRNNLQKLTEIRQMNDETFKMLLERISNI